MLEVFIRINTVLEAMTDYSLSAFNLSVGREDDSPRIRVTPSGDITFFGTSYHRVKGIRDSGQTHTNCEITFDSNIIVKFQIEMLGEWDEAAGVAKLGVIPLDRYTEVMNNIDVVKGFRLLPTGPMVSFSVEKRIRNMKARITDSDNNWPAKEWVLGGQTTALPPSYKPDKCYKQAKKYDGGKIYIADEDESFVSHDGKAYAAAASSKDVTPGTNDKAWVQVSAEQWDTTQLVADLPIRSNFGYMQDKQDDYFVKAKRTPEGPDILRISAFKVFDVLSELLQAADGTITINESTWFESLHAINPQIEELFIYSKVIATNTEMDTTSESRECEANEWEFALEDILEMLEKYFNVQWYLDGDEFKLLHPSDDCRDMPVRGQDEANFLYDYHARDFSNGLFRDDTAKLKSESWVFSDDALPIKLRYKVDYMDTVDYSYTKVSNDPVGMLKNGDDKYVIVATGAGVFDPRLARTVYPVLSDFTDYDNYNSELETEKLIRTFHSWGRPWDEGYIGADKVTLHRKRARQTEIKFPEISADRLNFHRLVITNFGNLKPETLQIDMHNGVATLTAVK